MSPNERLASIRDLHRRTTTLAYDLGEFVKNTDNPDEWQSSLSAVADLRQRLEQLLHLKPGNRFTQAELRRIGGMLRDRRNAAGFSRLTLARRASISDATIKFLETARHPPSRGTLCRLWAVPELKLGSADWPKQLGNAPEGASPAPSGDSVGFLNRAIACAGLAMGVGRDFAVLRRSHIGDLFAYSLSLQDRLRREFEPHSLSDRAAWVAAAYAVAATGRGALPVDYLATVSEAVRPFDRALALEIYQVTAWVHLSAAGALDFSRRAPGIRDWPVAAIYGYLHGGGERYKSVACAAVLAENSELAAGLAALLCFWGGRISGSSRDEALPPVQGEPSALDLPSVRRSGSLANCRARRLGIDVRRRNAVT